MLNANLVSNYFSSKIFDCDNFSFSIFFSFYRVTDNNYKSQIFVTSGAHLGDVPRRSTWPLPFFQTDQIFPSIITGKNQWTYQLPTHENSLWKQKWFKNFFILYLYNHFFDLGSVACVSWKLCSRFSSNLNYFLLNCSKSYCG